MCNLTTDEVKAWAEAPDVLRRDRQERDGQTKTLQVLLSHFGLEPGPCDDIFGGRTESALLDVQEMRFIDVDGACGPQTKANLLAAFEYGWKVGQPFPYGDSGLMIYGGIHPKRGRIPSRGGKVSWFGGPDDEGDRGYGQALIPVNPPTVERLYEQHCELVSMGLFRTGLKDPLPMTTCCGKSMQAGISWCLDPESYYLAMRWASGQRRPSPYHDRVLVERNGKLVVVAPTDWGPAKWTGKNGDLSHGAIVAIDARTGQTARFTWAEDDTPLGPVG